MRERTRTYDEGQNFVLFDDNKTQHDDAIISQAQHSSNGQISPRFDSSRAMGHGSIGSQEVSIASESKTPNLGFPREKAIADHRGSVQTKINKQPIVDTLVSKQKRSQLAVLTQSKSTLLMELALVEEDMKQKSGGVTIFTPRSKERAVLATYQKKVAQMSTMADAVIASIDASQEDQTNAPPTNTLANSNDQTSIFGIDRKKQESQRNEQSPGKPNDLVPNKSGSSPRNALSQNSRESQYKPVKITNFQIQEMLNGQRPNGSHMNEQDAYQLEITQQFLHQNPQFIRLTTGVSPTSSHGTNVIKSFRSGNQNAIRPNMQIQQFADVVQAGQSPVSARHYDSIQSSHVGQFDYLQAIGQQSYDKMDHTHIKSDPASPKREIRVINFPADVSVHTAEHKREDSGHKETNALVSERNPIVEPTAPKQVSFINLSEIQRVEEIKERRKVQQTVARPVPVTTFDMQAGVSSGRNSKTKNQGLNQDLHM